MKKPIELLVSFRLLLVLFAMSCLSPAWYSNASAQETDTATPCMRSPLCRGMYQVINKRRAEELQLLIPILRTNLPSLSPREIEAMAYDYLNAQIVDHISTRFGYGLSSAEMKRTLRSPSNRELQALLFDLSSAVEDPGAFLPPGFQRLASAYSLDTPVFKKAFNPIVDTIERLQEIDWELRSMLEMGSLCKNKVDDDGDGLIDAKDPSCAGRKLSTAEEGDKTTDIRGDSNFLRINTRNSAREFRLLLPVFGSQSKVDGTLRDSQTNLSAIIHETLFNHFNVDYMKVHLISGMGPDGFERAIHREMFNTFLSLLTRVIQHPAMLYYLDNQSNRFDVETLSASNQNLGRELLELHTLGLGPDKGWRSPTGPRRLYTQKDVENSSLLLTGVNVSRERRDDGTFRFGTDFRAFAHVPDWVKINGVPQQTSPVVMGKRFCLFPAEMREENAECNAVPTAVVDLKKSTNPADKERYQQIMSVQIRKQFGAYLKFLANHEKTKANICNKLVRRFVANDFIDSGEEDDPETVANESRTEVQRTAVVDRCIAAWGQDGDLTAMYKAILTSTEVWASTNYNRLFKNPLELVASAARASGLTVDNFRDPAEIRAIGAELHEQVSFMGLPYRNWMTPTGYNENSGWLSQGYLVRWITSSFKIASYLESRSGAMEKEQFTPIMGFWMEKGLKGSFEETCRSLVDGPARYEFVRQLLGYGDIRQDSIRIRRKTADMLSRDGSVGDGANYQMVKQRFEQGAQASCVKSAMTSILASQRFTRK